MQIIASEKEINKVIHFFRPDYPEQHLSSIQDECYYILNGVQVKITLEEEDNAAL